MGKLKKIIIMSQILILLKPEESLKHSGIQMPRPLGNLIG